MTAMMTHPSELLPPTAGDRLLPARPTIGLTDHHRRVGALPHRSATELAAMVDAAGLQGRGGAGFPTARKIAAVAAAVGKTRRPAVVVANCCEGDPTAAKDRVLIDRSPHLVIDGAVAAARGAGRPGGPGRASRLAGPADP